MPSTVQIVRPDRPFNTLLAHIPDTQNEPRLASRHKVSGLYSALTYIAYVSRIRGTPGHPQIGRNQPPFTFVHVFVRPDILFPAAYSLAACPHHGAFGPTVSMRHAFFTVSSPLLHTHHPALPHPRVMIDPPGVPPGSRAGRLATRPTPFPAGNA
jgi:hypothetical protein